MYFFLPFPQNLPTFTPPPQGSYQAILEIATEPVPR